MKCLCLTILADVNVSDTGVWTLAGLLAAGIGFTFVWLLKIDRTVTSVKTTLEERNRDLEGLRTDNTQQIQQLWHAHRDDVKDLGQLLGRLTVVETKLADLQTTRGGR